MTTKQIQKTIVKRQHKLVDYDRFRVSFQKYQAIQDRSPSEEKNIIKLEGQLATATQDYQYLNDLLKQDLVRFLRLATEFITPIQTAFFHLQCSLVGSMYGRIYEVAQNKAYFTTIDRPLEEGYATLVAQNDVKAEIENLELFRKGVGSKNSMIRPGQASLRERVAAATAAATTAPMAASGGVRTGNGDIPGTTASISLKQQQQQHQEQRQQYQQHRRAPPAPPPRNNTATYVIALYDLDAQQEGDLSIRADDRIEVLERTEDTMDWWKGRIGDRVGMFPGNYVREL
ncbi:hypothetical protein BX666DRAFT_1928323 [Dichotomocladium elegans]|nr:hypothetical protein BX666DRAFT_1928323 [Dichotomocladium elegans]